MLAVIVAVELQVLHWLDVCWFTDQ